MKTNTSDFTDCCMQIARVMDLSCIIITKGASGSRGSEDFTEDDLQKSLECFFPGIKIEFPKGDCNDA